MKIASYYPINIVTLQLLQVKLSLPIDLGDLTPYTRYDVTVACIPLVGLRQEGFWSDPSVASFSTAEDGMFVCLFIV